MQTTVSERVQKHRAGLRAAGLRPVRFGRRIRAAQTLQTSASVNPGWPRNPISKMLK